VGALWSWAGTSVAFAYSAVLFLAGALLVCASATLKPGAPPTNA